MLAVTTFHPVPLLVEYSIFKSEMLLFDHVIECVVPGIQDWPPFGEVTVTLGAGTTVKLELLASIIVVSVGLKIRIRACEVAMAETFHV